MPEGEKLKLAYLLRDPNSGTAVVPDLFHLGGTWTVRALLPGYPGSTTLGEFNIQLPAPASEEFGRFKAQYDAILNSTNRGIGLKVEGYLGDVSAGQPVVSGVLTKMNLPLDAPWELIGSDTLWWLQQSQLMPGEIFAAPMDGVLPTGTLEIVQALSCTQEVVWDDDFHNWNGGGSGHTSADYSVSGFSFTAADPYNGDPALTATTSGDLTTTTSWNGNAQYSYSTVTIHGTCVAGSGSPDPGEASIWLLSDAARQNAVLVQMFLQPASGVLFNVAVFIVVFSGGAVTFSTGGATSITNVHSPFPFELTAVVYQNAGKFSVRAMVNGMDTGFLIEGISVPASGRIGLHSAPSSGGSPAVYINRLQFRGRTQPLGTAWSPPRFGRGTQVDDGASIAQEMAGNGATHLDMLVLAATLGGSLIRKNPGAGAKADTLDYGSPGVDRSAQIVLEEGVNVLASGTTLANVAEVFGTDARVNGVPGSDSGGTITWGRIGSAGDMVLVDTVSDVGPAGYRLLAADAQAIQARKGAPVVATQLAVVRTAKLLEANNGFGPRELDTVQIHLPTYGIRHQAAMIVGYTITEGSGTMTYYLTQFPEARLPEAGLQRLARVSDYLTLTYRNR